MFVYRNANTGDDVEYEARSARLDHLPNWQLVSGPPASEEGAPALVKPKASESKDVWARYIVATTDLSEAEANDLTKAELMKLAAPASE